MFKRAFIILLLVFSAALHAEKDAPRIGIIDIMSTSFEKNEIKMFTDVLRTELYKLDYFNIVERGVIQQYMKDSNISGDSYLEDASLLALGKQMNVDKLLICTMNSYAETTAVNIRIIDVTTSYLDFTENVFLKDANQIFDALKDLVLKIELNFIEKEENGDPMSFKEKLYKSWKLLGANEENARHLSNTKVNTDRYLDMRQYDITFSADDYAQIVKAGQDEKALFAFFKEGIPYSAIKKAFDFGIVDLENYLSNFKPYHLSFEEYLDAYEHNILTPQDYMEYKKGFKKFQFLMGAGGVANDLPVANADFSFFLLTGGVEYYLTDYQRDFSKVSTEMGLYMMNAFVPSPYFQVNAYMGQFPFYAKGSLGVVAEVFLGGHVGVFAKLGAEVNSLFEFNLMLTFLGTQPKISYTDMSTKIDEKGYAGIVFPYMAATFTYKF